MTGIGQTINILAFPSEGRVFESPHRRSTFCSAAFNLQDYLPENIVPYRTANEEIIETKEEEELRNKFINKIIVLIPCTLIYYMAIAE